MKRQESIDLTDLLHGKTLVVPSSCDFVTATLIADCHCKLGEGIIFDDRTHSVLWTDILGKRFHKLELNYEEPTKIGLSTYDLPKMLGSFGMLENPGCSETSIPLLCAWEDGFQLFDIEQQRELSPMSSGEDVNPKKSGSRLNDGRVDPSGKRFVAGGFFGGVPGIKMKVFRCEQKEDGSLVHEPLVDGLEVTNSICWSVDGSAMYLADSPTREIHSYSYNLATGGLSDKKLFHKKAAEDRGVPDGSCVDAEGYIWNAVWRDKVPGMVQRIDPSTGKVVFTVHLPGATSQASCCCFGGKDLDILFITTAIESLDTKDEPHAGGLYAARVPFKGCKEGRLKFKI